METLNDTVNKQTVWLKLAGALLTLQGLAVAIFVFNENLGLSFALTLSFSGSLILMHSFKFWWGRWDGFALHFISGITYLCLYLLYQNGKNFIPLLLFMTASYLTIGIFRLGLSLKLNKINYAWALTGLTGLVNLVLVPYLLIEMSAFGLFFSIAIDLILTGLALYRLGLGKRQHFFSMR